MVKRHRSGALKRKEKEQRKNTVASCVPLTNFFARSSSTQPSTSGQCLTPAANPTTSNTMQTPVHNIDCAEQPGRPIGWVDKSALSINYTETRLEFQSYMKIQQEHISQDKIQRNIIDHTVLGCLADLHSARTCCNRERKISLLKTLKRTIANDYSDFCGEEQQDAHEFLSVLLSQLKEEGVSLRTRVGLHPYTCTIEANFEFELLSTRTCLSCGDKVFKTESYNCLSVDFVPGGSVQDSLALYFKICEVECHCDWCFGHLASVEQKLQSLPRVLVVQLKRFSVNSRGNLVKLHDRLHISPQLCLQAHSRANVQRPGMPKPHLTQGDCYETSPPPEGAVPFTAEKKSSVEGRSAGRIVQDSYVMNEYRITSVLSHIGSNMQYGHYICESSEGNKTWLSFDDERGQQMDQKSALRRRSTSAYMLFYEYRGAGG
ncbi:hypothetical protein SKAU_G00214060 [Synaphobranchus kaupii]|uniref:USP domain-containing protein n=1 Tax=Synaphobranchus kaupii TaxID=118154 RepID=A0A9Q1IUU6_SYNKA|nr:hypothetical protein SKAU_G00214060 [Synaphobranchus kaupii]